MNKSVLHIVFVLSATLFCKILIAENHALIIAVGDYTEESEWLPLSSENDAIILYFALQKRGFSKNNISVLKNNKATKQGIISAFEKLEQRVDPGDMVYLHFSGHGQQIFDDSNDELDGFDESLVPIDAMKVYSEEYKGQNHIRDDEIYVMLSSIRKKLGKNGELFFTIDACNSGTIARNLNKCRGTDVKFVNPILSPYKIHKKVQESFFNEFSVEDMDEDILSPVAIISASAQDELNFEYVDDNGKTYGSLSFVLAKVFASSQGSITYRTLFEQIKLDMSSVSPKQTPEFEGNADKIFMGNRYVYQQTFFKVKRVLSSNEVVINSGSLSGLTLGSLLSFHNPGSSSNKNSKAITLGEVISLEPLSATVKLIGNAESKILKNSWVFLEKKSLDNLNLKLFLEFQSLESEFYKNQIKEKFGVKICKEKQNAEVLIVEDKGGISLIDKYGHVLLDVKHDDVNTHTIIEIVNKLQMFKQAKTIRELSVKEPSINVDIEIIPIEVKKINGKWIEVKRYSGLSRIKYGNYYFKPNECFKIVVKNYGSQKAYFQIVDVMPNNKVGVLYPSESSNRTENEIAVYPNASIELGEIFIVGEIKGKEFFKVIATKEPIDLNSIFSTQGATQKEDIHEIEKVFNESFIKKRQLPSFTLENSANINTKILIVN